MPFVNECIFLEMESAWRQTTLNVYQYTCIFQLKLVTIISDTFGIFTALGK